MGKPAVQRRRNSVFFRQQTIEIYIKRILRFSGQIIGLAFAVTVDSERRLPGIKVILVGAEHCGGVCLDQVAKLRNPVSDALKAHSVILSVVQSVDFLAAQAEYLGHAAAGHSAQIAEVGIVDNAAPVGSHQGSAQFHELLHFFSDICPVKIEHRRHYQLIAGELLLHVNDVHRDPQLPEGPVVGQYGFFIMKAAVPGTLGILRGPPVFPVKQDGGLRL